MYQLFSISMSASAHMSVAQTPCKVLVYWNKVTVVLLYMCIFISSILISRHSCSMCYCALAIVVASGFAIVFAEIFQGVPIRRSGDTGIEGNCIDSSEFWVANAVINISTDVVVLALPIWETSKLQLKLKEKVLLYSAFLLGGLYVFLV